MLIAMPCFEQHAGEGDAGELAALVGVENLRLAVLGQGLLQRLDAEVRLHRDRHADATEPAGWTSRRPPPDRRSRAPSGCR